MGRGLHRKPVGRPLRLLRKPSDYGLFTLLLQKGDKDARGMATFGLYSLLRSDSGGCCGGPAPHSLGAPRGQVWAV